MGEATHPSKVIDSVIIKLFLKNFKKFRFLVLFQKDLIVYYKLSDIKV